MPVLVHQTTLMDPYFYRQILTITLLVYLLLLLRTVAEINAGSLLKTGNNNFGVEKTKYHQTIKINGNSNKLLKAASAFPSSGQKGAFLAVVTSSSPSPAPNTGKLIAKGNNTNRTNKATAPSSAIKTTTTTTSSTASFDNVELYEWESRLFSYLFEERGYSNRARPAKKRGPVDVTLELVILKINEILEIDQEIVISGFLKINWTDFRLTWRKDDFGGIDRVVTEVANIWLPDLALINSDDVYAITRDGRFPITLTSSGSMLYVPAGKINARCELNLRYFPFDSQLCHFRFESWVYNENAVKVIGQNLAIDDSHFIQNPQWALIDSFQRTTVADYDNSNFSRVEFYLCLKRKSLFFLTYTVFPCGIISCLQMFSHILPLAESERVNFGTTTLVAFAVFHISVVEQVPKSSEAIPLLAIYVDSLMCLIGVSLMESFFMLNWLSHVSFTVPSPILWYYIVEKMGNFLWLGQNGVHWRRHYLRVLARVRSRYEENRQREAELKRLAVLSSRHQTNAYSQEERARRMSYCSHIYQGYGRHNVSALVKLMMKYGDLLADINRRHRAKNDGGLLVVKPFSSDISNENNYQTAATAAAVAAQNNNGFDGHRRGDNSNSNNNNKRKIMVANHSFANNRRSNSDDEQTRRRQLHPDHHVRFAGSKQTPRSRRYHHQQANTPAVSNNNNNNKETTTTAGGVFQFSNFNGGFQQPPSPDDYPFSSTLFVEYATIPNSNSNLTPCSNVEIMKRQVECQLDELREIATMLGEIKGGLGNHSLKRECMGVWTVYITAVDRIVSVILFLICSIIPLYLFFIYPETITKEEMRQQVATHI